jgi:hypothetical protein
MLVDWLTGLIDKLLTARKVPSPVRAIVKWLVEKVLTQLVNWLELLAKWAWDKAAEPPKLPPPEESPRLPPPEEPPKPPEISNDPRQAAKDKWEKKRQEFWETKRPSWYPKDWAPPPWFDPYRKGE